MSSEMLHTASPAMTREERIQWWRDARFGMFIQEEITRCALERSDIITFHNYDAPDKGFLEMLERSLATGRPVICTEYLARGPGSTFAACLPLLRQHGVGAMNWGLVSGKTQTIYPWGWSREKGQPPVYFHDVFKKDGSFLYPEEEQDIQRARGGSDR